MYINDSFRLGVFMAGFGGLTAFNGITAAAVLREGFVFEGVYVLWVFLFIFEIICLADGFLVEPDWIRVSSQTFEKEGIKPEKPIRIVHLSDLHIQRLGRREEGLVKKVRELAPDLLLISGDYVNYEKHYSLVSELFRRLEAIAPMYLVAGNVDMKYPEQTAALQKEFSFLQGGLTTLTIQGISVHLVGADDEDESGLQSGIEALGKAPAGFSILLYHRPWVGGEEWIKSFDLVLCGHTHGGQVRLPWFGAVMTMGRLGKRFEKGLYRLGRTVLYVNSGFGFEGGSFWVPRVRFLCRPEIAGISICEKRSAA